MKTNKSFWAVIPAAGVGKRMAANRPKQYLELQNKTVIEHCLQRLLDHPDVSGAVIALDENDSYWQSINFTHKKTVLTSTGGSERHDSVINALTTLNTYLAGTDDNIWVLVHDAARPCVRHEDISKLIEMASFDDHGGLLASPVRDTMKRELENHRVQTTIDRTGLWHALTPQMFKLPLLIKALLNAREKGLQVTDDASAMELDGYMPMLVEGYEDNIKITRPFDLVLANLYLREQLND